MDIATLWNGLGWPLVRLTMFITLGLFVANVIEALNWTRAVARVAEPIVRLARLKDITGAAFSMAFFSGVAANTMLSESYAKGDLNRKDLVLSNLFNSLPTYFLHLPTMLSITLPFIGNAAFVYVGLTLGAALLRTVCIVVLGRIMLPPLTESCIPCRLDEHEGATGWREAVRKSLVRLKKRMRRILAWTLPIYTAFFFLKRFGVFDMIEQGIGQVVGHIPILPPEAMGIVVFHVAAEFTAGLAAAGSMLADGGLGMREVVVALLVGNVLSSPMRAFRHQFPYYAGIYPTRTALLLIGCSQTLRAASIIIVGVVFVLVTG